MLRASTWTRVCGKWQKSIQGKWQKWCVIHVTKNNTSATHFFALCLKPIARFCWKRARLSLFRPQPHLPSFIQIHPSFRDLLAKTTFQIVTIIGDPIADKNGNGNVAGVKLAKWAGLGWACLKNKWAGLGLEIRLLKQAGLRSELAGLNNLGPCRDLVCCMQKK